MKQLRKKCKCGGKVSWDYRDIDMAYSPMYGKCGKCGTIYFEGFFEERKKWCDEMNQKIIENGGVGEYNYFGGFHL